MNKQEKAEKILGYLGSRNNSEWIAADCSLSGFISFKVKGIDEPIKISSQSNITDSYREVAYEVVRAGYDYGSCKKIIEDENKEIEERVESSKKMSEAITNIIAESEEQRINQLSESEKLIEIYEKYGIKIISYEIS